DLLAQAADLPLADYLRGTAGKRQIAVNAALGALLQANEYAILRACTEGFPVLKLKVGMAPVADEIARLRQIAARLPAGHLLRLDANGAWCESDAERFLAACNGLPIEMVEEPLANPLADPRFDVLRRLQANCRFALALDESLAGGNPQAIIAASPVRRLILKPPRSGGLLPALALARQAASAGMHCVVTSSVDSACGVLAAAHLAAALDNDLAHGLATSSWLAADTGTPAPIASGRLTLPGQAGLGFTPTPGLAFSAEAFR
ncbi:MAG: enolase C-terminal domain-like protein, partial [Rhodocyclaceae bacterium]